MTSETGAIVETNRKSKYEVIADHLRRGIRTGKYPVGAKLPSVQELSRRFEFSPVTAFRAVQELAKEGLVMSHQGPKGTVVIRNRPPRAPRATTLACLLRPHRPHNEIDNFALDMIQGMREEISARDYRFVYHCLDEVDYVRRMEEAAAEDWVSGILLDHPTPLPVVRRLSRLDIPAVMLNRCAPVEALSASLPDYERVGQESARLLLNRGYARLAFYGVAGEQADWDEDWAASAYPLAAVRDGFRAAVRSAGLPEKRVLRLEDPDFIEPLPRTPEAFGLPKRRPASWEPVGILAPTDTRALQVLEALKQTDLALGRDVGLIGCCDLLAGRRSDTPPSTWKVDRRRIGAAAVDELISRIEDPNRPATVIKFPMEFVDRGTA